MCGTCPISRIIETSIGSCGWYIHLPYGPSESHFAYWEGVCPTDHRVLTFGASDAEPIVCARYMGSLQGAHVPLVEVRSANMQAFETLSLPNPNTERAVS